MVTTQRKRRPMGRPALWHGAPTALVLFAIIAGGPLVTLIGTARDAAATDLAESSIGFGGVLWATWEVGASHPAGAAVVRGYVVLNPKGFLPLTPGFGSGTTQGNAILHELGHATGPEHVRSTGEIMNAQLTDRDPRGLGPGDRTAPSRTGRAGGCVLVPAGVGVADLS